MFSQDYSQQSSAHAFPTTNKQLFCIGRSLEGGGEGAKFSKSHDEAHDKIETKTNKLVSRQSVSSEHSGDELFCLDDPNEGEGFGTFGGGARNARVVNGVIRLQSFTESDEEYRCEDDRRDALSEFQEEEEEEGAKKYQQKYQQQWNNNNTFTAVRRGKTVRDLIERIIEFSTEPQISVWEDVLLDLRRKEDEDARFVLDVNEARHLQFRVPLVEWILDVCAEAQFGPATADVAVEYMVRLYSFFLLPMIGLLCVDHARARRRRPTHFCFASPSFFLQKAPRKGRKSRKYLVQKKKSWKSRLAFLPFFKKKLRIFSLMKKDKIIRRVSVDDKIIPTTQSSILLSFFNSFNQQDRVLSTVMVPKSSLQLVALCCIQVAAKYEETEELVPSLSKLRYFGSNIYSVDIIRKMELAVCVELKWSMGVVRPSHFIEAILALTRMPDGGNVEWAQISDKIEDVSYAMYHAIVSDAEVSSVKPSRLALACICAARLQLESEGFLYNEPMLTDDLKLAVGDDSWLATNELELFSRNILERYNSSTSENQQQQQQQQQQQEYTKTGDNNNAYADNKDVDDVNNVPSFSSQASQCEHASLEEEEERKEEDDDMVYEDEEEVGEEGDDDDGIECDDDDDDISPYNVNSMMRPPTGDNDSIAKQRRSKNLVHMNVEMMMDKDHPKSLASHAASFDSMIDIISPTSPLDGPWF